MCRLIRKYELSLRQREKIWKAMTLLIGCTSFCLFIIYTLYIMVCMQGLYLSNEQFAHDEKEMSFLRVAALAKHTCIGNASFITIHCDSVRAEHGKFNESIHDPIISAANSSFNTMSNSSTFYNLLPVTFTRTFWIENQRLLMNLYQLLAGPALLIIISMLLSTLMFIPTYVATRRLHQAAHTRKEAMKLHNRSLEAILQETNNNTYVNAFETAAFKAQILIQQEKQKAFSTTLPSYTGSKKETTLNEFSAPSPPVNRMFSNSIPTQRRAFNKESL